MFSSTSLHLLYSTLYKGYPFTYTHLNGEKHSVTVRGCPEIQQCTRSGVERGPLDPEMSTQTMRRAHLSTHYKCVFLWNWWILIFYHCSICRWYVDQTLGLGEEMAVYSSVWGPHALCDADCYQSQG